MPLNLNRVSSDSFVCIIQSLPGLAAGIQHMAAVQQPAGESEHLHPQERVSYLQRSQLGLHQCDQWDPVPGLPAIRARQPCPAGPLHTPVLPSHHAHPGLCPAATMVRTQNDDFQPCVSDESYKVMVPGQTRHITRSSWSGLLSVRPGHS